MKQAAVLGVVVVLAGGSLAVRYLRSNASESRLGDASVSLWDPTSGQDAEPLLDIEAGPEVPTRAMFDESRKEFLGQLFAPPDSATAEAKEILANAAASFAGAAALDDAHIAALRPAADAIAALPEAPAPLLIAVDLVLRRTDGEMITRAAILDRAASQSSAPHPVIKLLAESRRAYILREDPALFPAALDRLADAVAATALAPDVSTAAARTTHAMIRDAETIPGAEGLLAMIAARLAAADPAETWLAHMLLGRFEIDEAWRARGTGYAGTVPEQAWQTFADHLDAASDHLTAACTLAKDRPEAPTFMITVTMGGGGGPDAMYPWFTSAVAAELDHMDGHNFLLHGLYPRWGGSHDHMYRFGLACSATKRFDTSVPYMLIGAVEQIAAEQRSWSILDDETVVREVNTVLDGYLGRELAPAGVRQMLSRKLGFAWQTGDFDRAREAWQAAQDQGIELDAQFLARFNLTLEQIRARFAGE